MSVNLILGLVEFRNFEIPQKINFGGEQALAVHQLVGGQRVIDSMGRVDDDITWSGLFFGEDALSRAQLLDAFRVQGLELPLIYSQFNYLVIIKSFRCTFERTYQLHYSITVTVLINLNLPFSLNNPISFTDGINTLLTGANALSSLIGISSVSSSMASLTSAIGNVPSFENASNAELVPVSQACTTAQNATSSSIGSLNGSLFPTT